MAVSRGSFFFAFILGFLQLSSESGTTDDSHFLIALCIWLPELYNLLIFLVPFQLFINCLLQEILFCATSQYLGSPLGPVLGSLSFFWEELIHTYDFSYHLDVGNLQVSLGGPDVYILLHLCLRSHRHLNSISSTLDSSFQTSCLPGDLNAICAALTHIQTITKTWHFFFLINFWICSLTSIHILSTLMCAFTNFQLNICKFPVLSLPLILSLLNLPFAPLLS